MIHEAVFKGKKFRFTDEHEYNPYPGCPNPPATFTFENESDLRERYWNIEEGDVVMDVGAAYGSYTLPACALGAKVYAFEPFKSHYDGLVTNLKLNGFLGLAPGRCTPSDLGLFDFPGEVRYQSYAPHGQDLRFNLTTMDTAFSEDRLDWVKIDVEGAEVHVLQGGKETLSRFLPNFLIECHVFVSSKLTDDVREFLHSIDPRYKFTVEPRPPAVMLYASLE